MEIWRKFFDVINKMEENLFRSSGCLIHPVSWTAQVFVAVRQEQNGRKRVKIDNHNDNNNSNGLFRANFHIVNHSQVE